MLFFDHSLDWISSGAKLKPLGPPLIEIVNFMSFGITSELIDRFISPLLELLHVSFFVFNENTFCGIGLGSQTSPIPSLSISD